MQKQNQLNIELDLTRSLKSLATAYEEISVMKMREAKGSVLVTRNFLDGLAEVFGAVRSSYRHQIETLMKKTRKKHQLISNSVLRKNGKELLILLSANNKLYGDIIVKTAELFFEKAKERSADLAIVGILGKELYEEQQNKRNYAYFEIPDGNFTLGDLKPIFDFLTKYEKVSVFYGQFENVIIQTAKEQTITGENVFKDNSQINQAEEFKSFFEPSLETIIGFFETQIFSSLFKQTIHEEQLSRYASRIKAMEQALENIRSRTQVLKISQRRIKSLIENKKQQNIMAGMSLWR
jgi:F0F1-type ATP synthase gamma subunit